MTTPLTKTPLTRTPLMKQTRNRPSLLAGTARWIVLGVFAITMLIPMYTMVINAFKPQKEIIENPLLITPQSFTFDFLWAAVTSSRFNVIAAYGVTLLFVVLVNLFCILLSAPVAYVIARGRSKWHLGLLLLFVTGLLCASAAAQGVAPPADRWGAPPPAASIASGAYHDALSTAASQARRFNFSQQPAIDKAPPDQSPIRVIINNGHGPHVNCAPMGAGTCH